jgi:hypothetical protein
MQIPRSASLLPIISSLPKGNLASNSRCRARPRSETPEREKVVFSKALGLALFIFIIVIMAQGSLAQNTTKMPAEGTQSATAESEALLIRAETSERKEAIAAAKAELLDAGTSRLENWIGLYGIIIGVMLAAFGIFTYRKAAFEAAKAVREEFKDYRDEIESLMTKAQTHTDDILKLSEQAKAALSQSPGVRSATSLSDETEAELKEAAKTASQLSLGERTAQDFRLLMFQADEEQRWQDYVDLADGMAVLHGKNLEDLDYAQFAKAYGHLKLMHYSLSAALWEDYLRRHPTASKNSRASALNNWGNALSDQAKTKAGLEADALFIAAGEKYAAALAIKSDKHEALFNWGAALMDWAKTKKGLRAEELFKAASEKYSAALAVKPDDYDSLYNWGNGLLGWAKIKKGSGADLLFTAAGEKYARALELKPDKHQPLQNWGNALLVQASRSKGKRRDNLLAEAEELCRRAEAVMPGSAAYDLACIQSLRRNAAGAAEWLRAAHGKNGACPNCAHIAADVDFDPVRNSPEFQAALVDIGCGPTESSES